ncbi:MAG: hypothetical protein WCK49_01635 [Myxococcaceae bacterium]
MKIIIQALIFAVLGLGCNSTIQSANTAVVNFYCDPNRNEVFECLTEHLDISYGTTNNWTLSSMFLVPSDQLKPLSKTDPLPPQVPKILSAQPSFMTFTTPGATQLLDYSYTETGVTSGAHEMCFRFCSKKVLSNHICAENYRCTNVQVPNGSNSDNAVYDNQLLLTLNAALGPNASLQVTPELSFANQQTNDSTIQAYVQILPTNIVLSTPGEPILLPVKILQRITDGSSGTVNTGSNGNTGGGGGGGDVTVASYNLNGFARLNTTVVIPRDAVGSSSPSASGNILPNAGSISSQCAFTTDSSSQNYHIQIVTGNTACLDATNCVRCTATTSNTGCALQCSGTVSEPALSGDGFQVSLTVNNQLILPPDYLNGALYIAGDSTNWSAFEFISQPNPPTYSTLADNFSNCNGSSGHAQLYVPNAGSLSNAMNLVVVPQAYSFLEDPLIASVGNGRCNFTQTYRALNLFNNSTTSPQNFDLTLKICKPASLGSNCT